MGNMEIPKWLKDMPLAPEFRPTDTEFADPIAYISKIEREASAFGICKIIPPLPKPSKRYVFGNLNKSLAKCPELGDDVNLNDGCSSSKVGNGDGGNDVHVRAVFTTRHQELGQCSKRVKGVVKENSQVGVHKQVWQSGEVYTLEQFEAKSKVFAKSVLGTVKEVNPLVVEGLFWKTASEKPIYIEYANDVPGSAFGEPEGQYRYFRRWRKRASYQSYRRFGQKSDCKRNENANVNESCHNDGNKGDCVSIKNEPGVSFDMTNDVSSPASVSEEATKVSKRKCENDINDLEGTAGWKLSNSPWNLQVIARSPGSLTRFMPDNIPGVTSPMVYVGMLFSWFAWHVEDHELHSMNYLHTGSPKTWYAVPGDHAFTFEEVICAEAYGGNIDRLAALTLLGEKTTLLAPELIISSGIPCCRLIQNPGEFVITFPRAYHVGFSHGFNCGEAANFGTSQWLKVAKEAAVRRAAMNYLPMLSHQQLLYLLTMSFLTRIPRSLLPGARSSRLRDRQKEERELSVKKAFMEDMLTENNILSALLKKSTCRVVTWNPDLLPRASKEVDLTSLTTEADTIPKEHVSHVDSESTRNNENDLFKEMSLYMENLNDLYLDDDNLSCDFQVDSGTLVCVACGILGFPFMCVAQPSERAYMELMHVDHITVQDGPGAAISEYRASSSDPIDNLRRSVSGDIPCANNLHQCVNTLPVPRGWSASSKFLRPRTFCLEHGLQIQELMQSRGGVNMCIICHSDYQKIKAHTVAVAEEIACPFHFNEILLEDASQEDLNLIDLAIDDEDYDEYGVDWTSKLGINLRYCVKARKNPASKPVQLALELGSLFSERSPSTGISTIKWKSRKSRTRINLIQHGNGIETKADVLKSGGDILEKEDGNVLEKGELIPYARRRYKVRVDGCFSDGQECQRKCLVHKDPASRSEDYVNHRRDTSSVNKTTDLEITEGDSAGVDLFPLEMSETLYEVEVLEAAGSRIFGNVASQVLSSDLTAEAAIANLEERIDNRLTEASISEEKGNFTATCSNYVEKQNVNASEGTVMNTCFSEAMVTPADGRCNTQIDDQLVEDAGTIPSICYTDSERHENIQGKGDVLHIDPAIEHNIMLEKACPVTEDCNHMNLDNEVKQLEDGRRNHDDPQKGSSEHVKEALDGGDKQQQGEFIDDNLKEDVFHSNLKEMSDSASEDSVMERYSDAPQAARIPNEIVDDLIHGVPHSEIDQSTLTALGETLVYREVTEEDKLCRSSTSVPVEASLEIESCSRSDQLDNDKVHSTPSLEIESCSRSDQLDNDDVHSPPELESAKSQVAEPISSNGRGRKRKNEIKQIRDYMLNSSGFIKSPCEGLRSRATKEAASKMENYEAVEENPSTTRRKASDVSVPQPKKNKISKRPHKCDIEGCHMSFETKADLQLHKRNRCPYEGCGKRFSSHKYAIIHQRVHEDDRPLKCPWKGCSMSFKWAWARTEHIRVHTGEKPYQCKVEGCGLSFRFVSDFSRHRRKTGHYAQTSA